MTQTVNINGQELELEQCVIDGDELYIAFQGDLDYYNDIDFLLKTREECKDGIGLPIVEVPEDEQFIKEYIESNLDSQIDDQVFNKLLEELDKEPDVMPSYVNFELWVQLAHGLNYYELSNAIQQSKFKEEYNEYLNEYRKELREWWITKSKRYIINDKGELLMSNGLPVSQSDIDASNTVKDIVSNSINKPIDKDLIS